MSKEINNYEKNNYETIRKCAEKVNESLKGLDFNEKHYQKVLVEELRDHFNFIVPEYNLICHYITSKGRKIQISTCRIDILVDEKIIIEIKKEKHFKNKGIKHSEFQCFKYYKFMGGKECYLIVFSDENGVLIEDIRKKCKGTVLI